MRNFQLAVFILFFLASETVMAEATCESLITYKWARREASNVTPAGAITVEVKKIVATGAEEAAIKAKIGEILPVEKGRAMEACRREHESFADCLSAKYAAKASVLNSLRFESRKSFEEAIHQDCSAQQGLCMEATGSEPQCVVKAEAVDAEAADAKGKGKEGAKEKKK